MKTAEELHITERERALLIRSRDILSKMEHHTPTQVQGDGTFIFDMGSVLRPLDPQEVGIDPFNRRASNAHWETAANTGSTPGTYACGTAGCIAGLMNLLAGLEPEGLLWPTGTTDQSVDDPLYWLFYPGTVHYEQVTPADAVVAINNFLETGDGAASWAGWHAEWSTSLR